MTGAPGRPIGAVGRTQIHSQVAALPNAESIMKHYDDAVADFIAGKPVVPDASLPEGIKQLLLGLATPVNLPFARELWTYNPSEYIARVKEPILVVIGKKDIQVDWQADGKTLETATAQENVTFVYPENADHVLKHEETPLGKLTAEATLRYNAPDRVLDQKTVETIGNWLAKQAT